MLNFGAPSFGAPSFGQTPMPGMYQGSPPMGQFGGQMSGQMPAQPPQQAAQGLSPASRIVANREEAMGVPADFNGNLMVFPDVTHNRVFVKRWNYQTGAADFVEYAPVQSSTGKDGAAAGFVAVDVFEAAIDVLQKQINALQKPTPTKGVRKNDPDE